MPGLVWTWRPDTLTLNAKCALLLGMINCVRYYVTQAVMIF
jgi:hypothetical protein